MHGDFEAREAEEFWRFISGSLDRLFELVETLSQPLLLWKPPAPEANSILVLARHTLGNAADNILSTLAGESIARDREAEFGAGMDRGKLLARWRSLRPELESRMKRLTRDQLAADLTHPRRGAIVGREVLIVVARHAAEHLGQAELTRDLGVAAGIG